MTSIVGYNANLLHNIVIDTSTVRAVFCYNVWFRVDVRWFDLAAYSERNAAAPLIIFFPIMCAPIDYTRYYNNTLPNEVLGPVVQAIAAQLLL